MTDEQKTNHVFARSRSNAGLGNGTDRLCMALYGRKARATDYLGMGDAKMLHDAADRITTAANTLAQFMLEQGFSTGHGDSVSGLLSELSWQLAELWGRSVELGRLTKIAENLQLADNSSKYAGIVVIRNGQPLTTVGNMLVEMMPNV